MLLVTHYTRPRQESAPFSKKGKKTLPPWGLPGGFSPYDGRLFPGLLRSSVTFTINESINILVMVIFSGMSILFGPIPGAVCLTILPEFPVSFTL